MKYLVALDVKVGYNNMALGDISKKYTRFVIYDCVFIFNGLMLGHKNASACFYGIIMDVLDKPDDVAVVYLDDKVMFEENPNKLWEAAVWVICKLATSGLMLNILKNRIFAYKSKNVGLPYGWG